jgi:hypothetical protein
MSPLPKQQGTTTISKEIAMLNKILLLLLVTALAALLLPTPADAYGAAHVGSTAVGPNGAYHTGATAASGPNGAAYHSGTTATSAGGGAYHAGSAGTYHYSPNYSGGAAAGGAHYEYIR